MSQKTKLIDNIVNSDKNITIKKIDLTMGVVPKTKSKKSEFIELSPKLNKLVYFESQTPDISKSSKNLESSVLQEKEDISKVIIEEHNKVKEIKLKKLTINDFTPKSDSTPKPNLISKKDFKIDQSSQKEEENISTDNSIPKKDDIEFIKLNIKDKLKIQNNNLENKINQAKSNINTNNLIVDKDLSFSHISDIISKPTDTENKNLYPIDNFENDLPLIIPQELPFNVVTKIIDKPAIPVIEDINELLVELTKKTKALTEDDTIIETFSFLGDSPKVGRISFKTYDIKHLYSKIDQVSISNNNKSKSILKDENINDAFQNQVGIFEELNIPDIIAIKDKVVNVDNLVCDKFSSLNEINTTNTEDLRIPSFIENNLGGPKLNKKVDENIHRLKSLNSKYNNKDDNNSSTVNINIVSNKPLSINQEDNSKDILKSTSPSGSLNIPNTNNIASKQIIDNSYLNEKQKIADNELHLDVPQDKSISYILPIDASKNPSQDFIAQDTFNSRKQSFKKDLNRMPSLVYSSSIYTNQTDIKKTYEKYSLDDFTYVTISYVQNKGLFYNLVQPELNIEQEKTFAEIKKIFFNTIDQNFYTFKGDKHSLELYTQKIFDITISKLSVPLSSLDKKLYFKFIQREFSGLGILTALLSDKKILEVSCAGEKTSVTVYHVNYGTLETNILFDSLQKLNQFVMILTKNMGLYVNSAHPIIDGYLPNGYKIEGIYSVGELSSRGSSFIIRKYLDEPITPVALINNGIGAIDVFAYVWSAIKQDYKIILTGDNDSFMILNSIALFYPNKKIISIQSYDRLKLPQKEWIKRIFTGYSEIDKKTIIQHTISERPDYIIVDDFSKDIFDVPWYSVNLFYVNSNIISQLKEQIKLMSQKAIIINLRRIKTEANENIQVIKIDEFNERSECNVVEFIPIENLYHLNLLSSSVDIVEFNKMKKYLRWLKETKIYDYLDFNNIINEFSINEDKVIKRLGIDISN